MEKTSVWWESYRIAAKTGVEDLSAIRVPAQSFQDDRTERQKGICVLCQKHFAIEEMEADQITLRAFFK